MGRRLRDAPKHTLPHAWLARPLTLQRQTRLEGTGFMLHTLELQRVEAWSYLQGRNTTGGAWGGRASTRVLARGYQLATLPTSSEASPWPRWASLGKQACSHDACWGEDRAHTQGVCDFPATGQRFAHILGVLVFSRQQLPSKRFPENRRQKVKAASMGTEAQGFLWPLLL